MRTLLVGPEEKATALQERLLSRGLFVQAMTRPIVPEGQARLRLQPSAVHAPHDLEKAMAIIAAGPALVLQEIGNLGTIAVAFPVAVFLLRMGREAIGASYPIDREPNLAIIAEKYGLNSPEEAGAMGVYATGTLIGTFVFAVMPPLIHALGVFDLRALAMSCGVGSGSMLAACTGGLVAAIPDREQLILALAAASNILTYATGFYAGIFVALPLTEWLCCRARLDNPCQPAPREQS